MQDIDKNYSSDEEDWRFPAELPALPNVSSIDVGTSAYKSSKQPGECQFKWKVQLEAFKITLFLFKVRHFYGCAHYQLHVQ